MTNREGKLAENFAEVDTALADPEFLTPVRKQMLRFATLQLGDPALAEDAVQEALVGALRSARSFSGRAALRTWIFAILKNKVADSLRQKQRLAQNSWTPPPEDDRDEPDRAFDERGHWQAGREPRAWGDPESATHDSQFWRTFETCLENLPGDQARVFMMREFVEMQSDEICTAVGISLGNLNVMLYRARLRLRGCLESNWFLKGESQC